MAYYLKIGRKDKIEKIGKEFTAQIEKKGQQNTALMSMSRILQLQTLTESEPSEIAAKIDEYLKGAEEFCKY